MTAKSLKVYGEHGRKVRVYVETTAGGTKYVRVRWREGGKRKTESWHDTRENREKAHAYAKGVAHRLEHRTAAPPAPVTLYDLYTKYLQANPHWRPSALRNNRARWKKFQAFAGMGRAAHTVTMEMIDEFRAEMRKPGAARGGRPHAVNQVGEHVKVVKAVFRFAEVRGLIAKNPIANYTVKLPKDEKRDEMAEYSNAEWAAVLGAMSPRRAQEWRPYCLILLAGVLSTRINALLHLRWEDVDLNARSVRWRAETDKMGHERSQALPRDAVRALRIARVWAKRDQYTGTLVFYGAQDRTRKADKPYTYQGLNAALLRAEEAAGVEHIPYRAMHGYRRTAGGNVLDATGDPYQAMEWLGQTDLRTTMRYLKKRQVRQRELAKVVSAPEHEAKGKAEKATKKQRTPKAGASEGVEA
jgi:integrase